MLNRDGKQVVRNRAWEVMIDVGVDNQSSNDISFLVETKDYKELIPGCSFFGRDAIGLIECYEMDVTDIYSIPCEKICLLAKQISDICHDKAASSARFSLIYSIMSSLAMASFAIPMMSITLRPGSCW